MNFLNLKKLVWPTLFSISLGYLEATVVVYLRLLDYPENIKEIFPMKLMHSFNILIEFGREISTILIILSVALIMERKNIVKFFSAFLYIFGLWDIFYYVWLKIIIDWPTNWAGWDILFLIPWVWIGPWICPFLISCLFILFGGYFLLREGTLEISWSAWIVFIIGVIVTLISFLEPAFHFIFMDKTRELSNFQPQNFLWLFFILGFLLMSLGLLKQVKDS